MKRSLRRLCLVRAFALVAWVTVAVSSFPETLHAQMEIPPEIEELAAQRVWLRRYLSLYDQVLAMQVVTGQLDRDQAAAQLQSLAARLYEQGFTGSQLDALLQSYRGVMGQFLAQIERDIQQSTAWPADFPAETYRSTAIDILGTLRLLLDEALADGSDPLPLLQDAARLGALARGQDDPSAGDPFAGSSARVSQALTRLDLPALEGGGVFTPVALPPGGAPTPGSLPSATTPGGNPTAGSGATGGSSTFQAFWVGVDADMVSGGGETRPGGARDGHLRVQASFDTWREIAWIALRSADANGAPAGGQVWHTRDAGWWILGVVDGGSRMNARHVATLGKYRGPVTLDLYAEDTGWFKPGQTLLVEAEIDGEKYAQVLRLGGGGPDVPPIAGGPAELPPGGGPPTTPTGGTPSPPMTPTGGTPYPPMTPPGGTPPGAATGGTPTPASDPAGSPAPSRLVALDAEWVGMDADVVSRGGEAGPDRSPDAHLRVRSTFAFWQEVSHIALYGADESGRPAGGPIWHTRDSPHPLLGVRAKRLLLNRRRVPRLGIFNGDVTLDLYAADPGWLAPGRTLLLEMGLGPAETVTRIVRVGDVTPRAGETPGPPSPPIAGTPGAPPPGGAMPPAGAPASYLSSLAATWVGVDRDVVAPTREARADGAADAHVRVDATFDFWQDVTHMALYTADQSGNPAGAQVWHTADPNAPFLGVMIDDMNLNTRPVDTLGKFEGTIPFDLYAGDAGSFRPGQTLRLEVGLGPGQTETRLLQVGDVTPTAPATTLTPVPGTVWTVTEPEGPDGWTGTWTRRSGHDFDVSWERPGQRITGTMTLGLRGEEVVGKEAPKSDGYACDFTGRLEADGTRASGTFECPAYEARIRQWSAVIDAAPASTACGFTLGREIHGKWMAAGGQSGYLGCPIMNEADAAPSTQGTTGRYAEFGGSDGGYILLHGSGSRIGQVFDVNGCIFKDYRNVGGSASWLGFPVSDAYAIPIGSRQDFEGGYIVWDSETRLCQGYRSDQPVPTGIGRETAVPGTVWTVTEPEGPDGWTGTWTRRSGNDFDVLWERPGQRITGTMSLVLRGEEVVGKEAPKSDGYACDFTGRLEADGTRASGTFECPTYEARVRRWNAVIDAAASAVLPTPPNIPRDVYVSYNVGWVGTDADVVGQWAVGSDNSADGHFTFTYNTDIGPYQVYSIAVMSSDSQGNPTGGQVWHSRNKSWFVLGVVDRGRVLNDTNGATDHVETLGTHSGFRQFDLYATNTGFFRGGQHFLIEVDMGGGEPLRSVVRIPPGFQVDVPPVAEPPFEFRGRITTDRGEYREGDAITVTFEGFPGAYDWIAIVPAGHRGPGGYLDWQWTNGARDDQRPAGELPRSGSVVFEGLGPGDYEVWAFSDPSAVGDEPRAVHPFRITRSVAPLAGGEICGLWRWFDRPVVVFYPDGRMIAAGVNSPTTQLVDEGRWEVLDAGQRLYRVVWPVGEDRLTLSEDASRLGGTNLGGAVQVTATRTGACGAAPPTPPATPQGPPSMPAEAPRGQVPSLAGEWLSVARPGDPPRPASIYQNGVDLVFVNEYGDESSGRVESATRVRAQDWNELGATVSADGNRIDWDNGSVWRRSGAAAQEAELPPTGEACDIVGTWHGLIYGGEGPDFRSDWTFTREAAGRYRVQESGAGQASGTAVLSGRALQIDWGGGWTGRIVVELDEGCTVAEGTNTFLTGDIAGTTLNMRLERAGAAAEEEGGIFVDATQSTPTTTPFALEAGRWYILEASGTFSVWDNDVDKIDAVWCYWASRCGASGEHWQQLRVDGQGLSDLSAAAGDPSPLPYNPSHVYRVYVQGQGRPLELVVIDAANGSGYDNSGGIRVRVTPAP